MSEEGIKKALEEQKERTKPMQKILLPGNDRPICDFAKDISKEIKGSEDLFYNPNLGSMIEIKERFLKDSNKYVWRIEQITAARFLNILEKKVRFYITITKKDNEYEFDKSPSEQNVKMLLENSDIEFALHQATRFANARLPYLREGKLILPRPGFNEELALFILKDAPEIKVLTLEEAKQALLDILKDFCFKTELDRTMALAAIITPACRGLYKRSTCRTPIFLYMGNRERCGKDYLAGITGIIYEGVSIENPPICNEDKFQSTTDELRKKITSALTQGAKRMHFSNNRGFLQNVVLESVSTAESWKDRLLGQNKEVTLPNELEISLSANLGLRWTPDFWNRCRPINLFYDKEDANSREFSIPDLHGHVLENRSKLLSAIFTLIKNWHDNGMPSGGTFTSFPEWARVVGGIMYCADLGDPCVPISDENALGGDTDTLNFKKLFEFMHEVQSSAKEDSERTHNKKMIMWFIQQEQANDDSFFSEFDFSKNSDRTSFGMKFEKYVGRILSDIKLLLSSNTKKSCQKQYKFEKVYKKVPISEMHDKMGSDSNLGNLSYSLAGFEKNDFLKCWANMEKVAKATKVTLDFDHYQKFITDGVRHNFSQSELLALLSSDDEKNFVLGIISKLKNEGVLYEPKPDQLMFVDNIEDNSEKETKDKDKMPGDDV